MTNRNRMIVAGACLLFAAAHRLPAQGNAAEIYGGYTYTNASTEPPLPRSGMSGWNVGAAGYANSWFGAGFEFSGVFGSLSAPASSGVSGTALFTKEYSYMVGPQFRFVNKSKIQSSFKWLVGGVFGQANLPASLSPSNALLLSQVGYSGSHETKFAMMFAVPVDVTITRAVGFRFEPGLYMTGFAPLASGGSLSANQQQWNFRLSVGPVFRLGHGK